MTTTIDVDYIARLELSTNEILVIRLPGTPTRSHVEQVKVSLSELLPNNRVLVIGQDTDISVIAEQEQT